MSFTLIKLGFEMRCLACRDDAYDRPRRSLDLNPASQHRQGVAVAFGSVDWSGAGEMQDATAQPHKNGLLVLSLDDTERQATTAAREEAGLVMDVIGGTTRCAPRRCG
jgi:hypothetical protein